MRTPEPGIGASRRSAMVFASRPYDRRVLVPAPWFIALALGVAFLVLLPARRLQLGGLSARAIGTYAVFVWLLGMAVLVRPGMTRFLIPMLILAYIAPFVAGPDRIARFSRMTRRGGGDDQSAPPRPPIKNVTPPGERIDPP
jgi:hypothetical protein